jgi:hypothetical protein
VILLAYLIKHPTVGRRLGGPRRGCYGEEKSLASARIRIPIHRPSSPYPSFIYYNERLHYVRVIKADACSHWQPVASLTIFTSFLTKFTINVTKQVALSFSLYHSFCNITAVIISTVLFHISLLYVRNLRFIRKFQR